MTDTYYTDTPARADSLLHNQEQEIGLYVNVYKTEYMCI